MADSLTVCLILEGSYPFITGGVSAWVQELMLALPEIRFALFTLSPKRDQVLRYELPPNVVEHTDIVLSGTQAARSGRRGKLPIEEIRRMHAAMASGSAPPMDVLLARIPAGHLIHDEVLSSEAAWQMVVEANQRHNPVYPFSDYFWSWKSAHDLAFTSLGAKPPEADVYHAISTGYAGLAGIAAKIRTGKAFLLTEHGLYHKEREMEIKRASFVRGYQRDMWIGMYYGLSRACYRYADLVISLFEYNRRRQMELGVDEDKAVVVPNGIDVPRYTGIERRKRPGFHVGLVGRVVPIKDVKTFILMAKVVSDLVPEVHFYVIGPADEDPAYAEDCNVLVRSLNLAEMFSFTGKQDVRTYYGFLDVLVLTSIREAQPLVILEAQAAGVPVVSTSVGNVPELLDYDDRFLAPSKDAEKLARCVVYVHGHPGEVADIVTKQREKVQRFYDKGAVFQRYREIYNRLARSYSTWRESASS